MSMYDSDHPKGSAKSNFTSKDSVSDPKAKAFLRLLGIMDELREKCPWDRKQTLETLRTLTIEETYELSDAILEEDSDEIKKELGDLMLHLVFYAKIGEEKGAFDIRDVLESICEKLIARHPHIYKDVKVSGEEEVKQNWERLKLKEGKTSVLSGVPMSLPALVKAWRVQEKVKGVGFEWDRVEDVWAKIEEELQELKEVTLGAHSEDVSAASKVSTKSRALHQALEEEFGDVLFSLVNFARYLHINPEDALERTNKKFIHRFGEMEALVAKDNLELGEMSLSEMDAYWEKVKEGGTQKRK